jgi:hypothetical protein
MMLAAFLRWEAAGLSVLYRILAASFRGNFSSRAAASAMSFATSSLRSTGIGVRPRFLTASVVGGVDSGAWSACDGTGRSIGLSGGRSGGRLLLSKATGGAGSRKAVVARPHSFLWLILSPSFSSLLRNSPP